MLYHQCMCFSHLMLDSITSVYNVRRSSTIRLVSSGTKKKNNNKTEYIKKYKQEYAPTGKKLYGIKKNKL